MSRIGKKPIAIPAGVTANIADGLVTVKGPKGEMTMPASEAVTYTVEDGQVVVVPANKTKKAISFWGMQRTLVENLIVGVTEGFSKVLEINGVGYRAKVNGKVLNLQLGFSHDVDFDIPEGIDIKTPPYRVSGPMPSATTYSPAPM